MYLIELSARGASEVSPARKRWGNVVKNPSAGGATHCFNWEKSFESERKRRNAKICRRLKNTGAEPPALVILGGYQCFRGYGAS